MFILPSCVFWFVDYIKVKTICNEQIWQRKAYAHSKYSKQIAQTQKKDRQTEADSFDFYTQSEKEIFYFVHPTEREREWKHNKYKMPKKRMVKKTIFNHRANNGFNMHILL